MFMFQVIFICVRQKYKLRKTAKQHLQYKFSLFRFISVILFYKKGAINFLKTFYNFSIIKSIKIKYLLSYVVKANNFHYFYIELTSFSLELIRVIGSIVRQPKILLFLHS